MTSSKLDKTRTTQTNDPVRVFISYSSRDGNSREHLERHLSVLKQKNKIVIWHDRMIPPGWKWDNEISNQLNSAHIILLLISDYFLDSEYCISKEMARAIERFEADDADIIPIILDYCDWENVDQLQMLQALPERGKPVKGWPNRNKAWLDVAKGIRRSVDILRRGIF